MEDIFEDMFDEADAVGRVDTGTGKQLSQLGRLLVLGDEDHVVFLGVLHYLPVLAPSQPEVMDRERFPAEDFHVLFQACVHFVEEELQYKHRREFTQNYIEVLWLHLYTL